MNIEKAKFVSFGGDGGRIYGMLTEDGREVLILPECEVRLSAEIMDDLTIEDDPGVPVKEAFLKFWDRNGAIDEAGETVLALYHEFAEELAAVDNPAGLSAKAYGCYGGYNSFPCDWEASRDCLLKLVEVDYKPFYADTLGYIYYYGRCNNGVPQYAEAFKYYAMAAFAGNYEANYKLADMFANGYYVHKDIDAAYTVIRRLYDENLPFITHGEFLSSFADIALRMGKLYRNVLDMNDRTQAFEVYRYLLQADFAIRMRIAAYDQSYGDDKVLKNVTQLLREQREICEKVNDDEGPTYYKVGVVPLSLPDSLIKMTVCYRDDSIVTFTPVYDDRQKVQPRFLLTIPDEHYCGLCDELKFRMLRTCDTVPEGEYLFDSVEDDCLFLRGERVLAMDAVLELLSPDIHTEPEYTLLGVRFEANGEVTDYLCADENVRPGDTVSVEGKAQTARVVKVQRRKESELANSPLAYAAAKVVGKKQ